MKYRHAINDFQDWNEGRVGEGRRREIQLHLDECDQCRRYFDKMTTLLEGTDPAALPRIQPDPFLPARIRAAAGEVPDSTTSRPRPARTATPDRPVLGRLGWSVLSAATVAAAAIGVLFGSGWSDTVEARQQAEDAAIVEAYYDAFSPPDIGGDWEYVLETGEGEDES